MAEITIKRWKKLGEDLILNYIDGIAKTEFYRPKNIGYPDEFKKLIVDESGDRFKMKKLSVEVEEEYRAAFQKAEKLLHDKKYSEAKKAFEKVLEFKPADETAKKKISLIDEALAKIEEIHNEKFNSNKSDLISH
ncbi:hypothetical protein ASZ90_003467 [hydrocarbon metagenome]|uniref:Uncharacterized protein n=1 Tax=hydrocarbon metagenome TaxID=938273 RepID=A0A0W8G0Q7_9ZZZZ